MEDFSISEFGALRLDSRARTLGCHGKCAKLGVREFELLLMLVRHAGRVVSYQRLNRQVWGETVEELSRGQRLTVLRLRRKLHAKCIEEVQITNVAGKGYRLHVLDGTVAPAVDVTHERPSLPIS